MKIIRFRCSTLLPSLSFWSCRCRIVLFWSYWDLPSSRFEGSIPPSRVISSHAALVTRRLKRIMSVYSESFSFLQPLGDLNPNPLASAVSCQSLQLTTIFARSLSVWSLWRVFVGKTLLFLQSRVPNSVWFHWCNWHGSWFPVHAVWVWTYHYHRWSWTDCCSL